MLVTLADHQGGPRPARIRACTHADVRALNGIWAPMLARGPANWLDKDWDWTDLRRDAAFPIDLQWVVLIDELTRDLLGVLVTSGPVPLAMAGLDDPRLGQGGVAWVENIAIAPWLRRDCPAADRREPRLKGVGVQLMCFALGRSIELGCEGRIGLHAEGPVAEAAYEGWEMLRLDPAPHPAGGTYPVFFGTSAWSRTFLEGR